MERFPPALRKDWEEAHWVFRLFPGIEANFRFYFLLLTSLGFIHFEVVLSGEKWAVVDQSGLTPVYASLLD